MERREMLWVGIAFGLLAGVLWVRLVDEMVEAVWECARRETQLEALEERIDSQGDAVAAATPKDE